jgi:hypothetical protein
MPYAADQPMPWPLVPDWSEGVTETLEWSTEVLRPSRSAAAQHRGLRDAPRRSFEWRSLAEGQERRLLDLLVAERRAAQWYLPIWPDAQVIGSAVAAGGAVAVPCVTTGRDFAVGAKALLYASALLWEVVTVAAIAADQITAALASAWPAGTQLYPLRLARLAQAPEAEALAAERERRERVQAWLDEPANWPAAMPTAATYRTVPVLEWRPEWSDGPQSSGERTVEVLDNGQGLPQWADMLGRALRAQKATWLLYGRTEQAAWRALLHALRGRATPVWVPSWTTDLRLVSAVTAVATTLVVEWCGYTLYGLAKPGSRDIRIELGNGTALCRRVTAAAVSGGGATETLTIDAALGVAVAVADVRQICFLRLATLASDTVQLEHLTDADGAARCTLAFAEAAE